MLIRCNLIIQKQFLGTCLDSGHTGDSGPIPSTLTHSPNNPEVDGLVWNDRLKAFLQEHIMERHPNGQNNQKPVMFKDKVNFKLPGGKPDLLHQASTFLAPSF